MITVEEIKALQSLIAILPNILIYIVPGFIFIQIYNYVFNIKGKEIKNYLFEYMVTSFIINLIAQNVIKIFNCYWNTKYTLLDNIVQIIICCISLISAYIIAIVMKSDKWTNAMTKININRNNSTNIFADLVDYEYGTWVRVYLNNEKIIYDGALIKFDYKDTCNDSFIVLEQYTTYKYGKSDLDSKLFNDEGKYNEHVAIKVSEINRIEATYDVNSSKLKKNKTITNNKYTKRMFNLFKKEKYSVISKKDVHS